MRVLDWDDHFLQQSEYTICCFFKDSRWRFEPHELGFATGRELQDKIWEFTIPSSERLKVLHKLDSHNLNEFSLFQDEESLLRTIALREIDFLRRIVKSRAVASLHQSVVVPIRTTYRASTPK